MKRFFIAGWVVVGGVLAGCSHDTAVPPASGALTASMETIAPRPTPEMKAASITSVKDSLALENYPGLATPDPRVEASHALDKLTVTSIKVTGYNVNYDQQRKALILVERRFMRRDSFTRRQILWMAPGYLGRIITHIEGAPLASLGEKWLEALWDGPNPVRITVQLQHGKGEVVNAYTNESTGQAASREVSSDDPIWQRAMEHRE
ncbi:hypothetical protein [Oleiharenicola lentus]|uniref:hypothetical protein n=1 Tax=Oleiharenicola lentus TaxID=2508720 RepID=UPI003F67930A